MEFFFLTQNNSVEIIILIILGLIPITIWGHALYLWIARVRTTLGKSVRGYNHETPSITRVNSISVLELSTANIEIPSANPEIPTIIARNIPSEIIENPETPIKSERIDTSQVEKLVSLVSSVRTLIARGMTDEAQTLIVEGLSIEKNNRDLNLLLGQIYEQDGHYEKAEYIYKDMVELHPSDIEILERLANVLIIEKKYTIASEIYKKIYTSTGNSETTLYMLTHISNMLNDSESIAKYAKQYILQWPKNPEIIQILANAQIALGHRKDAIETYKNLKNITPYNNEINEIIQKLLIEEELANNFEVKEK